MDNFLISVVWMDFYLMVKDIDSDDSYASEIFVNIKARFVV